MKLGLFGLKVREELLASANELIGKSYGEIVALNNQALYENFYSLRGRLIPKMDNYAAL